jgi:hypothetical protein
VPLAIVVGSIKFRTFKMIVFIDVKKDCTEFHPIDGLIFKAPQVTDRDNFKLFLATQSSEAASHDLHPNFFIDAGYLTQEVINFVETCGIPNIYAVKLMQDEVRIIATSGKQQRAAGKVTDSNTLTMRLIQHSIKLNGSKSERSIKRAQDELAHSEVTDRINALAKALDGLSPLRTIIHRSNSETEKDPINKAIENIAKELSSLTQQD